MPLFSFAWLAPLSALLAAGLFAGFTAGIFGVGGGFVGGLKAEYAHCAIGTSAATIIFTSIRSLSSHAKRGAVEFSVLKSWAPWLILGDVVGVTLAGQVDGKVLTLVFATGVALMSLNFLIPRLNNMVLSEEMPSGVSRASIAGGLGAFSSLLGIGGGVIAVMVMTLSGRSIQRAIATASGVGVLIAIPSAIGFAIIGIGKTDLPWGSLGYVNLPAMAAISSMSLLTAPLGVHAAHSLPAAKLKIIFGMYLVVIAFFMFKNALKV
jgi:uncharacterized membrane protein YfcA